MSVVQFEDVVDACILRLMAGEGQEDILTGYPDQVSELSSILSMIVDTRRLASEISIPQAAQRRSRAQFLSAVAAMQPAPRKPRFSLAHLRLATSAIIGFVILAAVLLGTGLASAAALPGDVFYPVKLLVEQAQINLVQDQPSRIELQEIYDSRRQQEAEQLSLMDRRQQVIFGGFLEQPSADSWQVGSVTLAFPSDFPRPTDLIGTYVQVTGYSDNKIVEVEDIQARQMTWTGILQKFDDGSWLIGGIALAINEQTHLSGGRPQIGMSVKVTAIRQSEDEYLALDLDVANEPTLAKRFENVAPLILTPPPLEIATKSQDQGEAGDGSQPAGQPNQQATVSSSAITTRPTRVESTPVIKTVTSVAGDKKDDDKSTPTPVTQVTVSDSDRPASSATLTPLKTTEKRDATRTPTSDD
jgi:hypothetical protein